MQLTPEINQHDLIDHNWDWYEAQVLAACCKSTAFFNRFKDAICVHPRDPKLRQDDFGFPADNLLYRVLTNYREAVAGTPGTDVVSTDYVHITLQALVSVGDALPDQANMALSRLPQILMQQVESVLPFIEQNVAYWLSKRRVHKLTQRLSVDDKEWKPEDVAREIYEAQDVQRLVAGETYTHLFGAGYKRQRMDGMRLQTGINRFDAAIGGGLGMGEAALFIAPQGAGKTVTACQLAATFALGGNDGMLISTEQSHEELEPRIISNCCRIEFDRIKDGIQHANLTLEEKERIHQLEKAINGRLTIYDWMGRGKSIAVNLREEVRAYREKRGKSPGFIIVDWIGGGLGNLTPQQMAQMRHIYQQAADEIPVIAKQDNMVAVAFMQANTVQAKNNVRIDSACIMECKTAGARATTVVGISCLQESLTELESGNGKAPYTEKQYWYVSKARKGTGGLVQVRRNFRFQRFENW